MGLLPIPPTFGEQMRARRANGDDGGRWLIPDLWRWGTIPMLGGNPKAGKTTMVADLTAALLVPGRSFLDHFPPATLTEEEERVVWIINAETPAAAFNAELIEAGLTESSPFMVDHLEERGTPESFDVTNPDRYAEWASRLVYCESCDGTDESPPKVVIVDGLTAILAASGKGVEDYGQWYAAFRRLMGEIDCPNALVVAHNTMTGGHLMGGVEAQAGPDGLWTYSSTNTDDATARRYFHVIPRLGGARVARTEIRFGSSGRLEMVKARPSGPTADTASHDADADSSSVQDVADRIAGYVREHPGADGQTLTDQVEASSKGENLAGRARAVESGLIREVQCGVGVCDQCARPHHRRWHYWPPSTEPKSEVLGLRSERSEETEGRR